MPFKYKKVLLKENDNITVNELCAIIKRRVRIYQIKPEPQYPTEFFTFNPSGNPAVARAIESIMAAGIASMQAAQPPHQRVESTQYPRYRRGNNYRGYNYNRQTCQYNGNKNGRGYSYNYNSRGCNRGSFQRGRGNHEHTARDSPEHQLAYRDGHISSNQPSTKLNTCIFFYNINQIA